MNALPRSAFFRTRQAGLSLIELMIAITIGVVLMLGMVEVFGTTRAVYQTTSALSRVQEGGRFAMDYLRSELRMAGQWGCANEYQPIRPVHNHLAPTIATSGSKVFPVQSSALWPYRSDLPIEGFEFENTAPGQTVALHADPLIADSATKWSPALPTFLADIVGDPVAPAVANSDIFVTRYASADYVPLASNILASGTVAVHADDADFINQGRIYVATDCQQVSLFQASTGPSITGEIASFDVLAGTGLNQAFTDGSDWWEGYPSTDANGGEGAPLHQYRMAVYYVGLAENEQSPSLYRRELVLNTANDMVFSDPQRLVDGVESMQLTFGVAAAMTTGSLSELQGQPPNAYVTAATLIGGENDTQAAAYVNNFRRVKKVRAALLLRGLEPAAVQGGDASYNVGDVTFASSGADGNLRSVYEAVVAIRNRY